MLPGAPAGAAMRARWGSADSEDAGTTHISIGIGETLTARGWKLVPVKLWSGLQAIRVTPKGLEGAADSRGEGTVGRLPPS